MIRIHKKDSIIDIIIKITHSNDAEIVLEFPFGHPVLHNYTSLKILKEKSEKKRLIIITNDLSAQKIGKKLGISYSRLHNTDLIEYNYSFSEYSKALVKSYINELKLFFTRGASSEYFDGYKWKYLKQKSRIWFFLLALGFSLVFLLFIFYFAVNKTYISITPEITAKIKAKNFTFQETTEESSSLESNIIPLKKIEKLVYLEDVFGTSGVNTTDVTLSRWTVTLKNKTDEQLDLRPNSRLQAKNGAVYIIPQAVSIPKANYNASGSIVPGILDVKVESKIHTITGEIAWAKANIWSWSYLFFPWLADQKTEIFATSKTDISWANSNITKILAEQDIENAKQILTQSLQKKALEELKKDIKSSNQTNHVEYKILSIWWGIDYSTADISGVNKLKIWEKRDNFPLAGSIKITSYAYNAQLVLSKLKGTIQDSILTDIEKILSINDESLRISHMIYQNKNSPYTIKATTQVEVFYIHNFLSKKNNYINKLTNFIQGMDKDEAEKLLLNSPRISNVDIEIRPFFMNTISKIPDNIIFTLEDK